MHHFFASLHDLASTNDTLLCLCSNRRTCQHPTWLVHHVCWPLPLPHCPLDNTTPFLIPIWTAHALTQHFLCTKLSQWTNRAFPPGCLVICLPPLPLMFCIRQVFWYVGLAVAFLQHQTNDGCILLCLSHVFLYIYLRKKLAVDKVTALDNQWIAVRLPTTTVSLF